MDHLHLVVWRCDLGACATSAVEHRDFYSKHQLKQHMMRMHAPPVSATTELKRLFESRLEGVAQRLYYRQRPPVDTICPYCPDHPSFKSWDDGMEHIGMHLEEEDIDFDSAPEDPVLFDWLRRRGYVQRQQSGWKLIDAGRATITVILYSHLKAYMQRELKNNQSLRSMLTVTGDQGRAYAASCEEYLEWRWPKHGLLTLATLEAYFSSVSSATGRRQTYQNIPPDYDMEIIPGTEQDFTVRLTGPAKLTAETVQLLAWLSAVFRDHQANELCSSIVSTIEKISGHFELSTLELQRIQDDRAPCWHDLFVNGIIARGFPIPARLLEGQEGIELPFHVMTKLAGVIYPVEYDGGVVLQGFSSLLSPSILQEDSVQWHYVSSKQMHKYLPTSTVAEFSRVKGVDIEHLTRRRTFLGYCRIIEICLGTAIPDYEQLDYSPASNDRRGIELAFRSLSAGTSGMSMINANANATITFPRSMISTTRIDHYEDILGMCRETPVLLYDAGEQRGWLVPMLSAILHMAHIWQVWARKVNMNLENSIPHAVLHWDGGQASFDVFLQNSGILLYRTLVEKADYRLKDLVIRMWAQLNSRIEEQKLVRTKTPGALILESKRLRGWEIMEIVKPNPIANLKMQEIPSDCSWHRLSEEVLVLFCQGLGDVMKPSTECTICPTWNPVPRGHDYLTASVQCLEWLSKKQGAKQSCTQLTDQLFWQPVDSVLLADCDHADGTGCGSKAQHLVQRKKSETGSSVPLERMGAVIFGQRGTKLHKEKTSRRAFKDDTDGIDSLSHGIRKILGRGR